MKNKASYWKAVLAIATVTLFMLTMYVFVSASETTSADLNIAYCNLSFENDTHIMYAIKSKNACVKLLIWTEPQNEYTLGTQKRAISPLAEQMTINGEFYTIFKYSGVTAKQMTDNVYVRACIDDGNGNVAYGEIHKYSILQYAYNKLGKTGVATTDEKLIDLINATLAQGAAAQKYFDYHTERLATDEYYQIEIKNGTLEDGLHKGLYKKGSKVTISAPATNPIGATFSHFTNASGKILFLNSTAKITVGDANESYTPVYRNIVASGKCGTNVAWSLDSNHLLMIYGTGAMTDISEFASNTTPWYSYRDTIKKVLVCEGVTSIGSCAFNYCSALENVSLPSTLTRIGIRPFMLCTKLKSITIPDHVTMIEADAFYGCSALTNVFFTPNSQLTTIGRYAFQNCSAIKTLYIPDGVTKLQDSTFAGMSALETVYIPKSVTEMEAAFRATANIKEIHYAGTPEEWVKITKASGWDSGITSYSVIYSSPYSNS